MKRRNGECPKLRRPVKRNKITDGIYGSTIVYLKFFMLWALVLLADFLLEFRFEFLWPFWLLLRSVYDSYKYQGLAFSVFFVSIALTSDMICYFFIPVQWLFFAASTYVWVQYVWHTEKGICLPTVLLWVLFAYMEVAVRLKDLRHMPFHLDLCRPFAAHCIGYPVVTLGFGFKSYVSYRIRQKCQKDVRKMNCFYMNLLEEALPIEDSQKLSSPPSRSEKSKAHENSNSNGVVYNFMNGSTKISHRKSLDKGEHYANGNAHIEIDTMEKIKECEEPAVEPEKEKTTKTKNKSGQNRENASQRERRNKSNKDHDSSHSRDEYFQRLETDVRRLRSELQSSRQGEQELRCQLSELTSSEKTARAEITLLTHQKDELQSKVQSLSNQRHNDRQSMSSLEKKLGEERRLRCNAEAQLALERKNAKRVASSGECSDSCKSRRRDLEAELKALKRELKLKEEQCATSDRELQSLLQYKESQMETERLVAAVTTLQEKNSHLENSLSAENRIKLDLFSALGETRRHLEIRDSLIRVKEREIEELKAKMAQVLAVMPSAELAGALNTVSHSKLRGLVIDGQTSTLDPNASVYTPKQGHLTTEA